MGRGFFFCSSPVGIGRSLRGDYLTMVWSWTHPYIHCQKLIKNGTILPLRLHGPVLMHEGEGESIRTDSLKFWCVVDTAHFACCSCDSANESLWKYGRWRRKMMLMYRPKYALL